MSLQELHDQEIDYLNQGKFAEGIEDFYAEDVIAQENTNPPTQGREAIAANERRFLQKVTAYHGIEVLAKAIDDQGGGNGVVFYEAVMRWTQADRGEVVVEQTVVERWENGRIAKIRFYGNFAPGPLPA